MSELRKIIIGDSSWTFLRFLTGLAGLGLLIGGFVLTARGTAGGGSVDLSMVFLHGKLEGGSTGLLFSLLGFILLLVCRRWVETSVLNVTRRIDGTLHVDYRGSFGKDKADDIVRLLEGTPRR